MKLSLMGTGLPIIQDQKGVIIPADRRLPKTYQIYKMKETPIQRKIRILKEQRLASIMGLR